MKHNIIAFDPFDSLDTQGVGALMDLAVRKARKVDPNIKVGLESLLNDIHGVLTAFLVIVISWVFAENMEQMRLPFAFSMVLAWIMCLAVLTKCPAQRLLQLNLISGKPPLVSSIYHIYLLYRVVVPTNQRSYSLPSNLGGGSQKRNLQQISKGMFRIY